MNTGLCQRAGAQLLPRVSRVCGHRRGSCLRPGSLYNEDQSTHLCVCVRVHTRVSRWAAGAAVRSTVSAAACVVVTLDRTPGTPCTPPRACMRACVHTHVRVRACTHPTSPARTVDCGQRQGCTRKNTLPPSCPLSLSLSLSFLFLSTRTREHAPRLHTPSTNPPR